MAEPGITTNLCTFSEELGNIAWGVLATVDSNVATAPDLTVTADRINDTSIIASDRILHDPIPIDNTKLYTASI